MDIFLSDVYDALLVLNTPEGAGIAAFSAPGWVWEPPSNKALEDGWRTNEYGKNGGGELLSADGFSTLRAVALTANGGTLAVGAVGQAVYLGNITGSGNLTFGDAVNTGVVNLGGINTYTGNSTIASGNHLADAGSDSVECIFCFHYYGNAGFEWVLQCD